jgi:hypothetical protein
VTGSTEGFHGVAADIARAPGNKYVTHARSCG